MSRNAKYLRAAALGLTLVVVAGCTSQGTELVRFNDRISDSNRRLKKGAEEFRQAILPMSNKQPANVNQIKSAHENLLTTVKEIREERKKIKPPQVDAAEKLHKAYDAYLDGQQRMVETEFLTVVRYAETKNLSVTEKWEKI